MHYSEHVWFIFNTAAFHFRQGSEAYIYFALDNLPTLIGMPFLVLAFIGYYKRRKQERDHGNFKHL